MRNYTLKALFTSLTILLSTAVSAQDTTSVKQSFGNVLGGTSIDYANPQEFEIGPIRIEGADDYDQQAIKLIAGLRTGDKINIPGDKITKAIKNLWNEGLFNDVSIEIDREINQVVYLVIKLQLRPKLSRFKFENVTKREADKIREEIKLFSGKTITENLLFTTQNKVRNFYRDKGYYAAKVKIRKEADSLMNNSQIFIINVDKGNKVKIKQINFYGNESLSSAKLKGSMKDIKQASLLRIFKKSKFSNVAFERDKRAVIAKLNSIGLRDAQITKDSVYMINERNMGIDIYISEHDKYYFGDITWVGNSKFRTSYLDTVLGIKRGDIYNKTLLTERLENSQDGRNISSLYMDRGYLFFQINPIETNVKDNHINYQMRIIEGKEARIGSIIIKGNHKTNDHVIRREIRTKPGDLFNRNDIIRTQRELAQLGYFNEQNFQVKPIPNPQNGTVDIEYVVEEKSSDQIELSGGYGMQRVIGTLGLTFNNFSLRNIFNKSSWSPLPSGDGQKLSLRGQTTGSYYQSYTLSFTEPWMGGKKPNSLSFWGNHTLISNGYAKTSENYYQLSITGVGIGLGRRKKVPDDYFSAYYELSYQYYNAVNYDDFLTFSTGYSNDISLKYVLSRNSIDAPIYPREGSKITFTAKSSLPYSFFENKDYTTMSAQDRFKYLEYYKLKLTGEWYLPLTADKKLVLMPRFGFSMLGAYDNQKGLSPFERYYLGGDGLSGVSRLGGKELIALRGYENNSLSSTAGDPIIAKYTLELRYPISLNPQATVYALSFLEAGNTYTSMGNFNPFNVKKAAGVGVRIFLPMFGLLGLDYGWGFDMLDPHASGYQSTSGSDANVMNKGYNGKLTFTIGMNLGEL